VIDLPPPRLRSSMSVEEALRQRRSVREYSDEPLSLAELGQLLWSAYGVTSPEGYRTAPSAKALYPLEIYAAVGRVEALEPGIYRYPAIRHALERVASGDRREGLFQATFGQDAVRAGVACLAFTARYERGRAEFGEAGRDFVHMDLGHAGQNVHLQAEALGLGTVVIAAFRPNEVAQVLESPAGEVPVYLMPVGRLRPRHSRM
jgi:SagB-type dehydrogenase family enzyme